MTQLLIETQTGGHNSVVIVSVLPIMLLKYQKDEQKIKYSICVKYNI